MRCADCRRADPPRGWTSRTIITVYGVGDQRWERQCRDCAERDRVRTVLNREHALVGSD